MMLGMQFVPWTAMNWMVAESRLNKPVAEVETAATAVVMIEDRPGEAGADLDQKTNGMLAKALECAAVLSGEAVNTASL